MKVAVYSGNIPASTFIENLIRSVAADEFQVLIFGRKNNSSFNYGDLNVRILNSPMAGWRVVPFVISGAMVLGFRYPRRFSVLRRHIQKQNVSVKKRWLLWSKYLPVVINLPDIFHLQWVNGCCEWLFLKELFGVKYVVSLRGTQINYGPHVNDELALVFRNTFPHIDRFHAVSVSTALAGKEFGADPGKTDVIYSGLDLELLINYRKKDQIRRNEALQLLSVGRMEWSKGYQLAFDAIHVLLKQGYRIHYTIIGGEPDEEQLYQINDLGLNNYVTILNKADQTEVFRRMNQSDFLLHPSYSEGVSNAVLEAMALGLPVICSDCGGMAEVIEDKHNGWLFESRNADNLVDVLREVFSQTDDFIAEISRRAVKKVESQHSLETLGRNMISLYRKV